MIERAYDTASHFMELLSAHPKIRLVSKLPPPCLQVCFYWWPHNDSKYESIDAANDECTPAIVRSLLGRGFMIDFAPGPHGKMFRVVVNVHTKKKTLGGLLKAIESVASS